MIIVGAGLSGLIAAHYWRNATVLEAGPQHQSHTALLRFRTDKVSALTGIPFKKVRVHKGIYSRGQFVEPNIEVANRYSEKVLGVIDGDRSIWNLSSTERYVAPENFYERLLDAVGDRVQFDTPFDWDVVEPTVSTAPLPIALESLGLSSAHSLIRAPIWTRRYRICDARNLYQTIYFPDDNIAPYRASITGDMMIIEGTNPTFDITTVAKAFGVEGMSWEPLDEVNKQKFGKIADIPSDYRKALLYKLTTEHGIYSLGRFATWRNILLDDVVDDIYRIERFMKADKYDVRLQSI